MPLPLPGLLTIDTKPAEAEVFLDDESLGRTPLKEVSVEAGEHQLRVVAERYLQLEQALSITGRSVQQHLIRHFRLISQNVEVVR